jgi:hypothetical protein
MRSTLYRYARLICVYLMILSVTACGGPAGPGDPVTRTAPPTGTPVLEPTATPTLILTPASNNVGAVVAADQRQILESHLSPDGRWHAEVVAYECLQDGEADEGSMVEQLTLTHVSDGKRTTVDSQQISCSLGLGAYGLGSWFWSSNSRFFYYTDAREGVPDGGGSFCWDRPLIRLDVTDGSTIRLGKIWAPSPEGTTVAMGQEDDLVLWDLDQGEIARTSVLLPEAEVCDIAWSPDGRTLAYLQTPCPFCFPGEFHVVSFDVRESRHSMLLKREDIGFASIQWKTAGQIRLSGYSEGGEEWTSDLPVEQP